MPSIVQASAAQSEVTCLTTVPANTENDITVVVKDGSGNGIEGIGPAATVLAVSPTTGNTLTQPAAATDANGITACAFESTAEEAKTVSVAVGGMTLNDQPVVTVGSGASVFSLDWGTATGNSDNATSDGGLATVTRYCASTRPDTLSVVDQATLTSRGLSWSLTPNVLSIRSITGGCGHVELIDYWDAPSAGDRWAVRYYVANGAGQTDTKQHPHCYNPVGSIQLVHCSIWPTGGGGGAWRVGLGLPGVDFPWYANDGAADIVAAADAFYRMEHIIHWVTATTLRIYPRLYNAANVLLSDSSNWLHSNGEGTLDAYYAGGGVFTPTDLGLMRTISWGMGQSGGSDGYFYVGDVALRPAANNTDFIGA